MNIKNSITVLLILLVCRAVFARARICNAFGSLPTRVYKAEKSGKMFIQALKMKMRRGHALQTRASGEVIEAPGSYQMPYIKDLMLSGPSLSGIPGRESVFFLIKNKE